MAQNNRRPGGPTRKEIQSEQTRTRLIEAAKELFAEYGYHSVSVTDIARAAGVSHGMINVYFNAKAGLLYQIIHESNHAQIEAAREVPKQSGTLQERIAAIVRNFAHHDLRDTELLAVMQSYFWLWPAETETMNRAQLKDALEPIEEILREAVSQGRLNAGFDVSRAVRAIFAIYTMGLRAAVYDGASKEDCIAEILAQIDLLLR